MKKVLLAVLFLMVSGNLFAVDAYSLDVFRVINSRDMNIENSTNVFSNYSKVDLSIIDVPGLEGSLLIRLDFCDNTGHEGSTNIKVIKKIKEVIPGNGFVWKYYAKTRTTIYDQKTDVILTDNRFLKNNTASSDWQATVSIKRREDWRNGEVDVWGETCYACSRGCWSLCKWNVTSTMTLSGNVGGVN